MSDYCRDIELWFSDTVGTCFKWSARDGYDSYRFSKDFLTTDWGISVLTENNIRLFDSVGYMYSYAKDNITFIKGNPYDEYLMWMYGYLVKYWVYMENISPVDIWRILPVDVFDARFNFYHTQGWNYIIGDAKDKAVVS